ncbi:hypothetical protein PQX77_001903 [Marasmius sp. AFHP31]|nr:hypothetical protein PQX77_001903 [Marasmius sp. AFHP31]
MSIPSNFCNAQHTTIGDHANLQAVAGDLTITHNYHTPERDLITISGRTLRRVIDGDTIFRRLLSSKVVSISINQEGPSMSTESQVFRIKKTVQTAKIVGHREKFTATTLEPVDEKDRDEFVKLVKHVLEAAMCQRSTLLTQMFAVADSNALTLIVHDELAKGLEFALRYQNNWIVLYFLNYACMGTIESLREDETITFPVTRRIEDWLFNLKSLTWQFDPVSVLLNPPPQRDLISFFDPLTPLRQETLPRLHTAEIVACVENSFGDVLHLIAPFQRRWGGGLSKFTQHGLLTFGAVIDYRRGILAHFSSTPSPEWYCESRSSDLKASFSNSVPWRVDLAFCKTGDDQVILEFGLGIPRKHRSRLCCAYLCQSLCCCDGSNDAEEVVFIEEIGFRLLGAFLEPASRSTPAYLFVPPLPTEFINNMHCVRYPFPKALFYWSHDPQGRTAITEDNWERFSIPELRVQKWLGHWWEKLHYEYVCDHLRAGNYELDGTQYARDNGYPELIHANPHDITRVEELENSHSEHGPSLLYNSTSFH